MALEDTILDAIGLPLRDGKVVELLRITNTKLPEKGHHAPTTYNIEDGFSFQFRSRYVFEHSFLEPPFLTFDKPFPRAPFENPDDDVCEPILEEVSISDSFKGPLPFGLVFGVDNVDFLSQGKPYQKIKYSEGYGNCFLRGKYNLELQYTGTNVLHRVRISLISNYTKTFLRRKELLKEQNKNIKPERDESILLVKPFSPTTAWRERMAGGDECFSAESIDATDVIIDKFLEQLVVATQEKKANKVWSAVKKVVISLNKLNDKHNHIETMEREEMCEFIDTAVKATGYIIEKGEDITCDWREW